MDREGVLSLQYGLPSSKTTLTDYQCVSTGCCTHVAKTEITNDNQHVTKSLQRYRFLPKQPKENTEKITNLMIFSWFGLVIHGRVKISIPWLQCSYFLLRDDIAKYVFFACSLFLGCSHARLSAWLVQELWDWVPELIAVVSERLSELKLFPLRTFLRTFIASIMNGDCH